MSSDRANPFSDLSDFAPKPSANPTAPIEASALDRLAEDHGFPSRQAVRASKASGAPPSRKPGRRYVTGRNQQINIKATAAVIERLYKAADARNLPLGEVLSIALDALEERDPSNGTAGR